MPFRRKRFLSPMSVEHVEANEHALSSHRGIILKETAPRLDGARAFHGNDEADGYHEDYYRISGGHQTASKNWGLVHPNRAFQSSSGVIHAIVPE